MEDVANIEDFYKDFGDKLPTALKEELANPEGEPSVILIHFGRRAHSKVPGDLYFFVNNMNFSYNCTIFCGFLFPFYHNCAIVGIEGFFLQCT